MAGTVFLLICLAMIWYAVTEEDFLEELRRIDEEEDELN